MIGFRVGVSIGVLCCLGESNLGLDWFIHSLVRQFILKEKN